MIKKSIIPIAFSILVSIVGTYILVKAPDMGSNSADKYVSNSGGDLDTNTYLVMVQSYVHSYSLLGGILLFIGLLSLSWIVLFQINKNK